MIYLVAALSASTAALTIVAWYHVLPWRRLKQEFVIVGLKSGASVDGVLVHKRGGLIELRNARRFGPDGTPYSYDGSYTLERASVEGYQHGHRNEGGA